jgi:HlyD family secretion protein
MQRTRARQFAVPLIVLIAVVGGAVWYQRHRHAPLYYTGFVEGEERIIRSEVSGRVLQVKFAEGDAIPAEEIIAVLDDRDIQARIKSKQEEIAVLDAEQRTQAERVALVESTWARDVSARRAELQQAESAADLAERTFTREQGLVKTGASTAQLLDDNRARRDQARAAVQRAREVLARAEAEERSIAVARRELESLQQRRDLAAAQLAELQVTQSKYIIRSPGVATVVQTQFIWPGELAQPGTAIVSVLDPADKYVQIYVPVADVGRLQLGQRVEIELDSRPGQRVPGEVSFIADKANFTPEKIETRSDRMGQVYRAKVRILEGVERFQPGTEGNVYLSADGARS